MKLKFSLILMLLLSISTFGSSYEKDETKNILILFSRNEGVVAYQLILNGFKNVLGEEYSKPNKIYIEYLDVGKFPDISYQEYLFARFNEKYKDVNLDLLILAGSPAISLMEPFGSDKLKNLPTISISLPDKFFEKSESSPKSNTTRILLNIDAGKTFNLAFNLFPECSNVYIISGSTTVDKYLNNITITAAQEYQESKNIVNLSDLKMDQLLEKVSQIPDKSIIILPSFTADVNHVIYNTPEVIRLLNKKTSTPIFVMLDTSFEEDVVGGFVTNMQSVGTEAGYAAIKVLAGQNPNTIHVTPNVMNLYMFNWRELKRWGLEDSEFIPSNSIILHRESSFIEEHKWWLVGVLLFITLQTLLVANLVRLNRKQKLTTQKLIETENHYRELSQEDRILRMGELTASLSHELNQPLTAIRNSAQAGLRFMQSGKSDPEMMDEILQNIVEDDKRASDVLSSIRQLMRFEKREKQKIDLHHKIRQIIDIFKGESKKQNIFLNVHLPNHPVYVLGDRTQIQQVLLNLISNAANAMEGTNNKDKTIDIIEKIDNESVTVSVRDYGAGIDESIKSKLFKPFITTKENGTGIGLAISKTIIDEHGGKIWAENNPDGGATFSFQLNLYKDDKS